LKQKLGVLYSICYDAYLLNNRVSYIKDFVSDLLVGTSDSTHRVLSKFGICFHPCTEIKRQNSAIVNKLNILKERMLDPGHSIDVKVDDFNWVHVQALPSSSNCTKFSKASTVANIAVKLHEAPRLGQNVGNINHTLLKEESLNWIDSVLLSLDSGLVYGFERNFGQPTYFGIRNYAISEKNVKKLYSFSLSTVAGSQKNFTLIGCLDNRMKDLSEMESIIDFIAGFTAEYLKDHSILLIGDFYVFRNALHALWTRNVPDKFRTLRPSILCWPDAMHIALNAQEAVLLHAFSIISDIWISAFPDAPLSSIKIRPIRRVAILSFLVIAWNEIREDILKRLNLQLQMDNAEGMNSRRAFLHTLVWLFEEVIPLALDAPALLSKGDLNIYVDVLQRLLQVFLRFHKKNYVVVVVYVLGLLQKLETMFPGAYTTIITKLEHLSSEDLEIFHSLLRGTIRFQDSYTQVSQKALFITARESTPIRVLSQWSEIQKLIDEENSLFGFGEMNLNYKNQTYGKRYEAVVAAVKSHLQRVFYSLLQMNFDIIGFDDTPTGSKTKTRFYKLALPQEILAAQEPSSAADLFSQPNVKRKRKNKTDIEPTKDTKNPPKIILTICENLLPLQLRCSTHVMLHTSLDISKFQSLPVQSDSMESKRSKKNSLGEKIYKPKIRPFLNVNSLDGNPLSKCGCKAVLTNINAPNKCKNCANMTAHLARESYKWFATNIKS
jgi:hypothetical protein